MGRELAAGLGNGPIMAQSSIALLQERFRQLERAKEIREERELSKVLFLSEPDNLNFSHINYTNNPTSSLQYEAGAEAGRLSFHRHLFSRPPPPSPRPPPISMAALSLSLWPADLSNTHGELMEAAPTLVVSLWPRETHAAGSSLALMLNRFDEDRPDADEVDTSLHL